MTGYLHLDVFTTERFAGNQLAVFLDAPDLPADLMQRIAREMAFSETTFVRPPEVAGTDWRMRIFTPLAELPMAGHPTIGTTFALADAGRLAPGRARFMLGLGIGPTPVDLEWTDGRLSFAWMTQAAPSFGDPAADVAGLASALGVEAADIRETGLPVREASSGVPFLYVPIVSRAAVDRAQAESGAIARWFRSASRPERPLFLFTLERGGDDATVYSRMFAPTFGVPEDPATGAASGPLGGYLVHHGAVPADRATRLISLQGVKMGRPSRVHIAVHVSDGVIGHVQVGGQSVVVGTGTLDV